MGWDATSALTGGGDDSGGSVGETLVIVNAVLLSVAGIAVAGWLYGRYKAKARKKMGGGGRLRLRGRAARGLVAAKGMASGPPGVQRSSSTSAMSWQKKPHPTLSLGAAVWGYGLGLER